MLTAGLVTAAALAFSRPAAEAVVIGMALALSSTAIALQIMGDRKMTLSAEGRSGFAVLLFQDVIVIAMIASLPLLASFAPDSLAPEILAADTHGVASGHGEKSGHGGMARPQGLWLAYAIAAVFGGMILSCRILLKPFFRLIVRSRVRETFTAVALLLVAGAALLMNWLGLSAALGAFIAALSWPIVNIDINLSATAFSSSAYRRPRAQPYTYVSLAGRKGGFCGTRNYPRCAGNGAKDFGISWNVACTGAAYIR